MTRGATLSFDALADVDDVYGDELQNLAALDDGYHGHYHLTDKDTLMAQSRAENLAAVAAGIDLKFVQGDGGLKGKARLMTHADDC